jgi:hypothetical protein
MPEYKGLSVEGLDKKGLSIIYITAFQGLVQIVRQTSSKLQMGISPMHEREGLSSLSQYVRRFQTTVYKRYIHIPSSKQTISSGYKVWMICPNKGLKV